MTRPISFPAHLWATLTLGLPLVGSQLGQLVIHVTDTLLLGRYGVADLAAQAVASSVLIVTELESARFSARNALSGTISRLQPGAVNTEVVIDLMGGGAVAAIVTQESSERLALAVGKPAEAIFKASSVILGVPL